MRPVRKGSPPKIIIKKYEDAKIDLIARIGAYCSYCERKIDTGLAVEHIQAKSIATSAHLINDWHNFLLACVNCNACKSNKELLLAEVLLPDRDNTFLAYTYLADGRIAISTRLSLDVVKKAENTLALVGLDKPIADTPDENGKQIAVDRLVNACNVG